MDLLTDQEISVAVVHRLVLHRAVAQVHVHGQSVSAPGIAGTANRMQSSHKVHLSGGHIERIPAHLVRVRVLFVPCGAHERSDIVPLERLVDHRWAYPVQPAANVFGAGSREGTTGELFGVQTVGALLRGVLTLWESVRAAGVL